MEKRIDTIANKFGYIKYKSLNKLLKEMDDLKRDL